LNGDNLIERIRTISKDRESEIVQGKAWADREIVLALNASQDIFINYCINNKNIDLISGLLVKTKLFIPTEMPVDITDIAIFVDDNGIHYEYMQIADGVVGAAVDFLSPAQIYLGGEFESYFSVNHNYIALVRNILRIRAGTADGYGYIRYWKKPSYIGATSLGHDVRTDFLMKDFPDFVYDDIFVSHAKVLLGFKTIQNQMDIKKYKDYIRNVVLKPAKWENYVQPVDIAAEIVGTRNKYLFAKAGG